MAGSNWMPKGAVEATPNNSSGGWMPKGAMEVKPMFANQQESDAGQAKARQEQKDAEFNAIPQVVISRGLDMATNPMVNSFLGNIPNIVSKAVTGKPFVDPESQMKWLSEPLGMAGGASGAAVAGVGNAMKAIPSIVEKGFSSLPFLQKAAVVGKSSLQGAAGMATQLPNQDNLGDNVKQYAGQIVGGAAAGPLVETGIKGVIGVKNAFKPIEDKLFDAYNYVFGVKGKIPQNLKTAKADTIAKVKAIQDNTPNEMENPLTGENFTTPSNRYETAIAHTEAKKNIWKKVTDLSKGATEADAKIDLPSVVTKAFKDTISGFGDVATDTTKKATVEAIKKQAELISSKRFISPVQAEEFMKSLFDDIKAVRQSGQPVDYSIKDFYSNLQRNLGDETDNVISSTLEKYGYKDARREYAIAKSSEKEVLAAANKFLREHGQQQGVAHPITNIWALNDILHSAVTGDPSGIVRGITIKTASKLLDFMKNPDNKVRMIFDLAKKIPSKSVPEYFRPVDAEVVPKGGYKNIPVSNQQGLPAPNSTLELPNNYAPRRGATPEMSRGELPDPGNSAINQTGFTPRGLPSPKPLKQRPIPSRVNTPDIISGDNPIKKLPRPDTVYGNNFTMKNSTKKGTVISNAEAGKNPLDERKVGLESDPSIIKSERKKTKLLNEQGVQQRQDARAFIRDIKGKLSNKHTMKTVGK